MSVARTRLAAYAVMAEDGCILLCRLSGMETDAGKWTLPGGGLEFGEHPEHAARREIWEETGYEADLLQLLLVESEVLPTGQGPLHAIRFVYEGRRVGGELRNETHGSTEQAEWVPLGRAQELPMVALARTGVRLAQKSSTKI